MATMAACINAVKGRTVHHVPPALASWFLMFMFLPTLLSAGDLKPFDSDGCSGFPDGTLQQQQLWLSCCIAHDFSYWQGGTYGDRVLADRELERCVVGVGEPQIALLMLAGVRVGGTPYLPTQFRWGYGWPYLRTYKALTIEEKAAIKAMQLKP